MPDVLLFGATGYTGTLTAHALARRGTSFAIAGRDPARLERLAAETGGPETHVVAVGDVDTLVAALQDAGALITCVGPFKDLGTTAVVAALRAGKHYVDSSGEIDFIGGLIDEYDEKARSAGIVMAPAAGFDEVPSDLAVTLATEGLDRPDAVITYGLPSAASAGTVRTILGGSVRSRARFIEDGRPVTVEIGARTRWSPMPPPLGPKFGVSFPFAEGVLAPLHLDLNSLELYAPMGVLQARTIKVGLPLARAALRVPPLRIGLEKVIMRGRSGPDETKRARDKWMLLAEATSPAGWWRNIALSGSDPYGLTAETLAAIGTKLARDGHEGSGVMSPVQAMGSDRLQKELIDLGVDFQTWEGA